MKILAITIIFFSILFFQVSGQSHLVMLYSSSGMEYGKANAVDNDTN